MLVYSSDCNLVHCEWREVRHDSAVLGTWNADVYAVRGHNRWIGGVGWCRFRWIYQMVIEGSQGGNVYNVRRDCFMVGSRQRPGYLQCLLR